MKEPSFFSNHFCYTGKFLWYRHVESRGVMEKKYEKY